MSKADQPWVEVITMISDSSGQHTDEAQYTALHGIHLQSCESAGRSTVPDIEGF